MSRIIASYPLQDLLYSKGVNPNKASLFIGDERFAIPTKKWITGDFSKKFRQLKKSLEIEVWEGEKRDCDDFSRLAAFYANLLNARFNDREESLAIGEFWYESKKLGGGHAINILVDSINDLEVYDIYFYEPQECSEIYLTKKEIQSCYFARF